MSITQLAQSTGATIVVANEAPVQLTASAAKRIADIIQTEGYHDYFFRVAVVGGGCSGFRYDLSFDNQLMGDDIVSEQSGVPVVVDQSSMSFLTGATLDFVEDLMGSSFKMINPNASSSCGCGKSFNS